MQKSQINVIDDMQLANEYLGNKIIGDNLIRKIVLLSAFSAMTENIKSTMVYIRGRVSAGKSHVANETLSICPKSSSQVVANMSQKALFNLPGYERFFSSEINDYRRIFKNQIDRNNADKYYKNCNCNARTQITCQHEPIFLSVSELSDIDSEIDMVFDLWGIHFLFTDAADYDVLMMLKPILSSDSAELYSIVTETNGNQRLTRKTVIVGSPSFIFCSANAYDKDMSEIISRCVNVSVTESKDKIEKVIDLISSELIVTKKDKVQEREVKSRVADVFSLAKNNIEVKSPLGLYLRERLPSSQVTDMRAMKDYANMLKLHALFNMKTRPVIQIKFNRNLEKQDLHYLFTNKKDYQFLQEMVKEFSELQRTGLPQSAHTLWSRVLLKPKSKLFTSEKENDKPQIKLTDNFEKTPPSLEDETQNLDWWTMPEITKAYNHIVQESDNPKNQRAIQMFEIKHLKKQGFIEWRKQEDDGRALEYKAVADSKDLTEIDKDFAKVTKDDVEKTINLLETREMGLGINEPIDKQSIRSIKFLSGIRGEAISYDEFLHALTNGDDLLIE